MLIILWRALSWVEFSWHCVFLMASILSSVGEIPSADTTQHIKVTGCFINLLLLRWSCKLELIKQPKTGFRFWMCCSSSCLVIRVSSRLATTCSRPWRMMLIVRWKIAGDDAIPEGSLLFQYRPKCVLMVTNCWLSGSNGSFWWAFFKSSLMNRFPPCSLTKTLSGRGIGCWGMLSWGLIVTAVSTQPRCAISLWDMNHKGFPLAELDLFHNTLGFKLVTFGLICFLESIRYWAFLQNFGSAPGFSNLAVIPPAWHWIEVCNCVFTSCGRLAPETRILHIGFQSSLIRESQFLPKRDGRKPLTTRSGTVTLWFWYLNWTRNWPKILTQCLV